MSKDEAQNPHGSPSPTPALLGPAPVSADCRAKRLTGIEVFTECITTAPGSCPFLFIYGHGRFCTHPLREQIVNQTPR